MKNIFIIRIIVDVVIAFAVIQGWWFIALPLGLIGCWSFPYYVEIFIAGIAYDSLFGMIPEIGYRGYLGIIVSVTGLILVAWSKKIVRR